jgi:hypothetical protein
MMKSDLLRVVVASFCGSSAGDEEAMKHVENSRVQTDQTKVRSSSSDSCNMDKSSFDNMELESIESVSLHVIGRIDQMQPQAGFRV